MNVFTTAPGWADGIKPDEIVTTAPAPDRPRWYWLMLVLPWLFWRREMKQWRRDHVR